MEYHCITPSLLLKKRFASSYDNIVSRVPRYIVLSFFYSSLSDIAKIADKEVLVYNWLGDYVKIAFFTYSGISFALVVLPMGISVSAMVLEELIVCGASCFILIGIAGSLISSLDPFSFVVPSYSFADTDLFFLYTKGRVQSDAKVYDKSHSSLYLSNLLCTVLSKKDIFYSRGPCFSAASPYFESSSIIAKYKNKGTLCIDMESATLFALAISKKVELAVLFSISDFVGNMEWKTYFDGKSLGKTRSKLLKAAIDTLSLDASEKEKHLR